MRKPILAAFLIAAVTGACVEGTSPTEEQSPDALAASLTRTADSLNQSGDSAAGATYGMAADLIRAGARPTSITVLENGTPTPWVAIAQRYSVSSAACHVPTPAWPPAPGTTYLLPPPACAYQFAPVLFAWKGSDQSRMLLIVAPDGQSTPGLRVINSTTMFPAGGSQASWAALTDRVARQSFFATSGSVSVARPTTTSACTETPRLPPGATGTCTVGDFTIGFDLTLAFPSDSLGLPPAAAQRLVLAPRSIAGMLLNLTSVGSPTPITVPSAPTDTARPSTPPLAPTPVPADTLPSTLTAAVTSGNVAFTLAVRNPTSQVKRVTFTSTQRMDVRVSNSNGSVVYVWSADKLFGAMVGVDSIAPGATKSYVANWNSPPSGTFRALGFLTSSTHASVALTNVTIP